MIEAPKFWYPITCLHLYSNCGYFFPDVTFACLFCIIVVGFMWNLSKTEKKIWQIFAIFTYIQIHPLHDNRSLVSNVTYNGISFSRTVTLSCHPNSINTTQYDCQYQKSTRRIRFVFILRIRANIQLVVCIMGTCHFYSCSNECSFIYTRFDVEKSTRYPFS